MKKSIAAFLCFLSALSFPVSAMEIPEPEGFVNDFAKILDEGEKDELGDVMRVVGKLTGYEVVAVTVTSLQGESIKGYTRRLANKWSVGGKKDTGVVILIATEEEDVRVEVGRGLAGVVDPNKVLSATIPYFKKDDFVNGIDVGSDEVLEMVGMAEIEKEEMTLAKLILLIPRALYARHQSFKGFEGGSFDGDGATGSWGD